MTTQDIPRPTDPTVLVSRTVKDRKRVDRSDRVASAMLAVTNHLVVEDHRGRNVIDRMRDEMAGQLNAQDFDNPGGASSSPWCFTHELDPTSRDAQCTPHCRIEGIDVHDPTGEAGISHDKASVDLAKLDRHLLSMERLSNECVDILARYTPRPATDKERREVDVENTPGCQNCQRVRGHNGQPLFEPPCTKNPTDVNGNLPEPLWLCRACYQHTYRTGQMRPLNMIRDAQVDGRAVMESA